LQIIKELQEVSLEYWENILLPNPYATTPAVNEVPDIVSEYHYIERYGLPWAGGSFDQPGYLMSIMNVISNTKSSVEEVAERNRRIKDEQRANK